MLEFVLLQQPVRPAYEGLVEWTVIICAGWRSGRDYRWRRGTMMNRPKGEDIMRPLRALTVAVITSLCLCQPGYCFTQAECDKLATAQADPAGRQIVEKM